ncbi:hypothetical protein GN244_ATG05379 [Phytophthora infestans]|uniref:Uncharacterized protein n=1 Tax=Phytophthora infestans TaxID=4787 RepID=A0A833SKB4_PHYIN|nr:hypothetical protein GN244_ATG05379 [Phytophthora infestans]
MILKRDSVIIHLFEVLSSLRDEMVVGRDLMSALGMVFGFGAGTVSWMAVNYLSELVEMRR